MKENILKIHASPYKAVLAITGGGSEAIGELLRYGEGSNTLLEAVVPYAGPSLDSFLGSKPEKYCAIETAQAMAMAAYQRARKLDPNINLAFLIGLGATCSLVKPGGEREGRQHHVFIAVQTHNTTYSYAIELNATRNREKEESLTAYLIEGALALACGLDVDYLATTNCPLDKVLLWNTKVESTAPAYQIVNRSLTSSPLQYIEFNKSADSNLIVSRIIMPGSFNPPHARHFEMAKVASEMLGKPVDLEISITNVDKPMLNYDTLMNRISKLSLGSKDKPYIGGLYLTDAPHLRKKARLFSVTPPEGWVNLGATFVIGADTLERIGNPKYYKGEVSFQWLDDLEAYNAKFLVFHRVGVDLSKVGDRLRSLCAFVPEQVSQDTGISSTKCRKENNA